MATNKTKTSGRELLGYVMTATAFLLFFTPAMLGMTASRVATLYRSPSARPR